MAKVITAILVVTLLIVTSILNHWIGSNDNNRKNQDFNIAQVSTKDKQWVTEISKFPQFKGKNQSIDNTTGDEQEAEPAERIDIKDIRNTELVGIYASGPGAILLKMRLPDKKLALNKIDEGEDILEGWRLTNVFPDKVVWKHAKTQEVFEQYLFEPYKKQDE